MNKKHKTHFLGQPAYLIGGRIIVLNFSDVSYILDGFVCKLDDERKYDFVRLPPVHRGLFYGYENSFGWYSGNFVIPSSGRIIKVTDDLVREAVESIM